MHVHDGIGGGANVLFIRRSHSFEWLEGNDLQSGTTLAPWKARATPANDAIMDNFSPEFSQHWFAGRSSAIDTAAAERRGDESLSPSQQEALEALADRVSAARCVF